MTLDVGLVGTGNIARAHLRAYRDHPSEVTLAAVCDVDRERGERVGREFDAGVWTDYEAFVSEAPVDAVDVTLPHDLHHPVARAALEADKHVLCEKPLAVSMDEVYDLIDLAERRDRRLMAAQMQRYDPAHRGVKRLVEDGALGSVRHARADGIQDLHEYADPPHWLYEGDRAGGGGVISVLVHKLDLLRYFLGEPRRVAALGASVDEDFRDAEDYCVGVAEFEGGAMVDLFSTYSAAATPYGESYWLFGDGATVHAVPDEGEYGTEPRVGTRDGEGFEPVAPAGGLPTDDPFVNEILHFADCVEAGAEPLTSGRDNARTMATVFALYESVARDGDWVALEEVTR